MFSLNEVKVLGNITKDPEIKQTQGGTSVCTFSIATDRQWKNSAGEEQKEAEFHNIVAWGKMGEIIEQYCKKGSKILVIGRLKTRSWESEGHKNYRTEIIMEDFIILTKREKTQDDEKPVSVEDVPF